MLEPRPGEFRWGIIDRAISYWQHQSPPKQVVLAPVTWGNPVRFSASWGGQTTSGIPGWLRPRLTTLPTYSQPAVNDPRGRRYPVVVPGLDDPAYDRAYAAMVAALAARYDGNPGVAYVRIGTGQEGQEAYPFLCGGTSPFPPADCRTVDAHGWTLGTWYAQTMGEVALYRRLFRRTPLALDEVLAGFVLEPGASLPLHRWAPAAQRLLALCVADGVMVGFTGLRDESVQELAQGEAGNEAAIPLLRRLSAEGHPVELEADGPPQSPQMAHPAGIGAVVRAVAPRDVNLFGQANGDDAYLAGGRSASDRASWDQLVARLGRTGARRRAEAWHPVLVRLRLRYRLPPLLSG